MFIFCGINLTVQKEEKKDIYLSHSQKNLSPYLEWELYNPVVLIKPKKDN